MRSSRWALTMMMMIKTGNLILILILLVFSSGGDLPGQQKDFMTWYELEFDKEVNKKLDLSGEFEQRFKNNSLSYDRTMVTLVTEYGVMDFLDVALGARALLRTDNEENMDLRYRLHLDATGSYTLRDVDLAFRIRMQYGIEDLNRIGYSSSNELVNRCRIKAGYHIFGTRLGLSGSMESMCMLSGHPVRNFYAVRFTAGVQYTLNFRSEISIRYMVEDEFNVVDPLQAHILVFGFSHTL